MSIDAEKMEAFFKTYRSQWNSLAKDKKTMVAFNELKTKYGEQLIYSGLTSQAKLY